MIGNFSTSVTGLDNAQRGLQVTGQNLTNINTEGYTRRRVQFVDQKYSKIGMHGNNIQQVGTGVDVDCLNQIRNGLLDQSYRNENSKMNYYDKEMKIYDEITSLMIEGTDLTKTLDSLYGAITTLSDNMESVSARTHMVECAENFIYEANFMQTKLHEMQVTINEQIIDEVNKANNLIAEVYNLNEQICQYELSGDEASDLRDQRNVALDKLSAIFPITVTEKANSKVQIYADGRDLLGVGTYETLTVKNTIGSDGFLTPIWKKATDDVVDMSKPLNEDSNFQDGGTLKALLMARGNVVANYTTSDDETELYILPRIEKGFDKFINEVVTRINEILAPKSHTDGAYSNDNSQYIELFSRNQVDRYSVDAKGNYIYNEEDPSDYYSLYTTGNIRINPEITESSNYSKLCILKSGLAGDNTLLQDIISEWKEKTIERKDGGNLSFEDYLVNFLSDIENAAGTSLNNMQHQNTLVASIEDKRQAQSGVSLDEELSALIKYQHSYSAASRVLQTVDSMIETLILNMAV